MNAMLLAIMVAWALNITAVKALTSVLDEIWVATLRMVVASAVLTVCLLARDRRLPRFDRRQLAALGFAGFLMVYANQLLFSRGMHLSTATSAALIMALSPSISVAAAAVLFRERIPALRVLGIFLGFAGVALVIFNRRDASEVAAGLGEVVLLMGLITFVFGGALVQRLAKRLDSLVIGWAIYVGGTAMLVVHALATQDVRALPPELLDGRTLLLVLYSGVLGTAVSNVAWYQAIATVGMAKAALFFYWLPIFGIAFAAAFLGEALSVWHIVALAAVIIGTRLGTR
ncbi:DMT family transporter [Caenimonas sp. S4]|nr:DMT family transporter [Caenimonas soli]